jgi:hypothetical protein
MMQRHHPEWDISEKVNRFAVDVARCECVVEAREKGVDFLIMVDDDVMSDERSFTLPNHDVPVVTGLVPTWRMGKFHWATYDLLENGSFVSIAHTALRLAKGQALKQVYACGAALLCIRSDVFGDTDMDPLFSLSRHRDGTMELFGGEDIMFCRRMHEHDIPVYLDPTVLGEHISAVDMAATIYSADKEAARAGADTHSRMSFSIVVDAGELPFNLPVSESYRCMRKEWEEGARDIPAKPIGQVSYSKLHLA